MKIKNVNVYGLESSILRSRYPHQIGEPNTFDKYTNYTPGDEIRANKLAKVPSGSGHDNFLKGIIVQFDLQYPEYFSPQLQRYNWIDIISSQSKMHKITSRELTMEDFTSNVLEDSLLQLNIWIQNYNNGAFKKDKQLIFKRIIENLPSGYLKWMGISTNYLQLKTIYKQRKSHKLTEWREFCVWIKSLPMSELITNE